jgi:transcriptional regulator with PAS, ATPase and Fis domain
LLRVLQNKEVVQVGSSDAIAVDVRIVAATHRDLMAEVAAGRFREDLFHRLAVGILRLPALRDRGDDLDLLTDYFLAEINADAAGQPEAISKNISEDGRKLLSQHAWPGNVRELYHTLTRAAIWSREPIIQAADVQSALLPTSPARYARFEPPLTQHFDLEELLDDVKRHYIQLALEKAHGKKTAAAKLLGLKNHQTLTNWMDRLGIQIEDPA